MQVPSLRDLNDFRVGEKGRIITIDTNNNKVGFGFSKLNVWIIVKMMISKLNLDKRRMKFVIPYAWRLCKIVD